MPIDTQRLTELRRYEDREAGLSEEFLERRLGPGRAFALLSEPLGEVQPRQRVAWVVAPSIGPEHGNLRRLEMLVARRLAAAGFPALRIRPDLHPERGALGEIDLGTRTAEVDDAVALLSAREDVEAVGLLGAMFGGTVAALAAERLGAPALVLVEPVTRGKRYVRETVRRQAVASVIASAEGGDGPTEAEDAGTALRPLEELAAAGSTSIRGLRLTQEEYERISAVDLARDLAAYAGRSLVVGLSPSGSPSPAVAKLHAQLEALGGRAALEVLEDPLPAPFGEYYYRNERAVRVDTRLALDQRIAEAVTAWALAGLGHGPEQAAA